MAFTVDALQADILAYLDEQFVQPVIDQGYVDSVTIRRNPQGKIEPYIAVDFGDEQQGRARSFIGAWGDDYVMPVYFRVVGTTPKISRDLKNKLTRVLLGQTFPWAGQVRKRAGGGVWPVMNAGGSAVEAYVTPASFGIVLQMSNDA